MLGVGRRWIALVTAVVSAIGVVSFFATARYDWAWIAIGALALLNVAILWELWSQTKGVERARKRTLVEEKRGALDRSISEGRQVIQMQQEGTAGAVELLWEKAVEQRLREHVGEPEVQGFNHASATAVKGCRVRAQVAYLEALRKR